MSIEALTFPRSELERFWQEWLGVEGREVLMPKFGRAFLQDSRGFINYIDLSASEGAPCYVSVNPFKERDKLLGVERIFFDVDLPAQLDKAWEQTKAFAEALRRFYGIEPLVCFSGAKGYHVYAFLWSTIRSDSAEWLRRIYARLQRVILEGLKVEGLDVHVVGDPKRLARVPYSTHEKTGQLCVPITLDKEPMPPKDLKLDYYREHGIREALLKSVIEDLKREELKPRVLRVWSNAYRSKGIRPCIEAALHSDISHLMRVAVVAEYSKIGLGEGEIIEKFREARADIDFNEKTTAYQVHDIATGGYKPFTCARIRELGYCLDPCPRKGVKAIVKCEKRVLVCVLRGAVDDEERFAPLMISGRLVRAKPNDVLSLPLELAKVFERMGAVKRVEVPP